MTREKRRNRHFNDCLSLIENGIILDDGPANMSETGGNHGGTVPIHRRSARAGVPAVTAILPSRVTPAQFVAKWRPVALSERATAQSHFNDLCDLVDHPKPLDIDPTGEWFTFEKGVKKAGGGLGFADVWKRGSFAWEYKKKHHNLDAALKQLSQYALALENPPLQIVCDTSQFRIVTAYTNSVAFSYDLSLDDLLDSKKRVILETAFHNPKKLKPGADRSDLTKVAADKFSTLTQRLQTKGHSPDEVAHFVNRLVFLFFAEDVGILDDGFFRKAISGLSKRPSDAKALLTGLFRTLKTGGHFGLDLLPWINGGLFDEREALPLDEHEIGLLKAASSQDWAHIDPTIFGTLFERFLDPNKRAQIGAHYTDAGKIAQVIEPVLMRPLRAEWEAARTDIEALVKKATAKNAKSKHWQRAEEKRSAFLERLRTISILDPACGSGNFLYLALHGVKDLEHRANQECEALGLPPRMPMVGPEILHGIEINPLAAELARTTIWIGDIQWAKQNSIYSKPTPVLRRLDLIQRRDALCGDDGEKATWPKSEFIIGNPPFLGAKLMNRKLGKAETAAIRKAFDGRLPAFTDLVCYWFEQAREMIATGSASRVGFVSTNSIRKNTNLNVLHRITKDAKIFETWNEEKWTVEGAAVGVSIICFGKKDVKDDKKINGQIVPNINADLTTGIDLTSAVPLSENSDCAFLGIQKSGPFDVEGKMARAWMSEPENPNGRHNSEVLKPYWNGDDLTARPRDMWLIDLPLGLKRSEASRYASPFHHLKTTRDDDGKTLQELREAIGEQDAARWWEPWRPRADMRSRIEKLDRYLVTAETAQHRIFVWLTYPILPDKNLIVITRDDDLTFGILQSKYHAAWALRKGSDLENRPRYTHTTTFATYPFPRGMTPNVSAEEARKLNTTSAIEEAAARLDRGRQNHLYPASFVKFAKEPHGNFGARLVPKNPSSAEVLRKRTLTNLYNERPEWLSLDHEALDRAVATAYGWPEDISIEDALAALLDLNRERAAAQEKA